MNATRSILAAIALSASALGCTMHTPPPPTTPPIPHSPSNTGPTPKG